MINPVVDADLGALVGPYFTFERKARCQFNLDGNPVRIAPEPLLEIHIDTLREVLPDPAEP